MTWFTMMPPMSTPVSVNCSTARMDSSIGSFSGIRTRTKAVDAREVSRARKVRSRSMRASSVVMIGSSSRRSAGSIARRDSARAWSHAVMASGILSSGRVWPVGAVSMTTQSKSDARSATRRERRSKSAASSMPGIEPARSIWRRALLAPSPNRATARVFTSVMYCRASAIGSISSAVRDGAMGVSVPLIGRPMTSEVECAGSVETSSTRRPVRLAARATAAAHVVLPTPPLPPKNRMCRSSRCRSTSSSSWSRGGNA